MQRKHSFPVANCSMKMPEGMPPVENIPIEEDGNQVLRRQQLINFGHTQWGFNNWSWSVTKQDLDFVEFSNGKFSAGVCAFVSVSVKTLDIHRENVGYATALAPNKGTAIHKSRKCAVTDALRETLLSFGGSVATDLTSLLDTNRLDQPALEPENHPTKPTEPKPAPLIKNIRKDSDSNTVRTLSGPPLQSIPNLPVAKAHPMPANLPPRPVLPANAPRPPQQHRPNSNLSFVLQPVMGGVVPPLYASPPRLAPPHVTSPHMYPNYYEYPWHFTYESFDRHHGNVNLNFNIPPKNLVVNNRSGSVECKNACGVRQGPNGPEGEAIHYGTAPQNQGCWIKPTIFYDGFWTEQKVKKWVTEQVEKQLPEDTSPKSSSPSNNGAQPDSSTPPTSKT